MPIGTSGAHCSGVGCDHDSDGGTDVDREAAGRRATSAPHKGRRARGGRHERVDPRAAGRRAA